MMAEAHRSAPKRCTGTRRDGTPCAAAVMGPGARLVAHDPARATARDQARRKGGTNSAASPLAILTALGEDLRRDMEG